MTIPDEVERAASDADLAAKLREIATAIRAGRPIILADPDDFDFAARRLEAKAEISEAMGERAAKAGYEAYRIAPGKHWNEISEDARKSWRPIFRAALEAAISGKEG